MEVSEYEVYLSTYMMYLSSLDALRERFWTTRANGKTPSTQIRSVLEKVPLAPEWRPVTVTSEDLMPALESRTHRGTVKTEKKTFEDMNKGKTRDVWKSRTQEVTVPREFRQNPPTISSVKRAFKWGPGHPEPERKEKLETQTQVFQKKLRRRATRRRTRSARAVKRAVVKTHELRVQAALLVAKRKLERASKKGSTGKPSNPTAAAAKSGKTYAQAAAPAKGKSEKAKGKEGVTTLKDIPLVPKILGSTLAALTKNPWETEGGVSSGQKKNRKARRAEKFGGVQQSQLPLVGTVVGETSTSVVVDQSPSGPQELLGRGYHGPTYTPLRPEGFGEGYQIPLGDVTSTIDPLQRGQDSGKRSKKRFGNFKLGPSK
jgi:hypothetical protein